MRVAVVGHVGWIEFARVERVPAPGEIVDALETWEEPGGGGAVAAVQLARLADECLFLTALGDDALGHSGGSWRHWAFASRPRGAQCHNGEPSFTWTPMPSARSR